MKERTVKKTLITTLLLLLFVSGCSGINVEDNLGAYVKCSAEKLPKQKLKIIGYTDNQVMLYDTEKWNSYTMPKYYIDKIDCIIMPIENVVMFSGYENFGQRFSK